jgi:hypothetical protein
LTYSHKSQLAAKSLTRGSHLLTVLQTVNFSAAERFTSGHFVVVEWKQID